MGGASMSSFDPNQNDVNRAQQIIKREQSNALNWATHVLCVFLVSLAFIVNLFRGSSKNPSIINLQRCSPIDWSIFGGFILVAIVVCYMNVQRVQEEDRVKRAVKMGISKSDLVYND